MAELKQGLMLLLPVTFEGIDLDNVSRVEFAFAQSRSPDSPILKSAVFTADGSSAVKREDDVLFVPWTVAETYAFAPGASMFMDTRITRSDSVYQPPTNIVEMVMDLTLFKEE